MMTQEDQKDYINKHICRICEKEIISDKVRDQCLLKGNYRDPAHNNCTLNVTQKQSKFIPFVFLIFSNYHCHMFFKS